MIPKRRCPIHRDLGPRGDSAYIIPIYLGVMGLQGVADVVSMDGWTSQGTMVAGEENRASDRHHGHTTVKDCLDE